MGMGHPSSALALVDPETFTPAEMRLAQVIVSTARGRGTMWRGRLAECQVALALNAQHADVGTSDWDLKLPDGKTIEVKSCGEGKSFSIGSKPHHVDVWVFVHFAADEANTTLTVVSYATVEEERSRFSPNRKSPVRLSRKSVARWGAWASTN
jgi:hypothetical protein